MPTHQKPLNGNWFYRFKYNGESHFKGGFQTKKQANEAETIRRRQLIEESIHPERVGRDMTFEAAADLYLNECSYLEKAPGTWALDEARLPVLKKFFAGRLLADVQPEDVSKLREHLAKKGLTLHTVNHYHALLKAMYNWLKRAKRLRWIDNPAFYVDMAKVPTARVRFLYPTEEAKLTPAVRASRVWEYYYIALHTGMRESEICNLQVKNVDLSIGRIFVANSKSHRSRYVPLSEDLKVFLAPLVAGKGPESYLLEPHYHRCTVGHWFANIVTAAEVKDFTFHDLRHTFVANLLAKGEDIYKVSKIIGHSNVKVTQDHYGHLDIKWLQETVSKIDGFVTREVAVEA